MSINSNNIGSNESSIENLEAKSPKKRKESVSLEKKIQLFKEFAKTGEKISGKTVFNGYPLGVWSVQLRSCLKRGSITINPTEEQLNKLEELGILDRQIDSTADEKIDAMIEWMKKFPKARISSLSKQDVLKGYATTADEYTQMQQEYERMKRYYDYIRVRKLKGKLSGEQILKCKNGDIGGVFGYSNHIEELAKKFGVDEKEIDYILTNYGSIYGFYQAYKNKEIAEEKQHDFELIDLIANNVINVDCYNLKKGTERYDLLYKYKVVNAGKPYPDGDIETIFYSGLGMIERLHDIYSGDCCSVMERKYGIYDVHGQDDIRHQEPLDLGGLARVYNVSRLRINQRLRVDYKRLCDPRVQEWVKYDFDKIINSEYVTDEEKEQLKKLQTDVEDNLLHLDDTSYSAIKNDPTILAGFRVLYSAGNRVREKEEEKKKLAVKQNKSQDQENLGEFKENDPQDIIENGENDDIGTMSQEAKTDDIVDIAEDKINLEDMTPEQLQSIITDNNETIMQNENEIKKALIARILEQQAIISKQKAEMEKLKGNKNKEL